VHLLPFWTIHVNQEIPQRLLELLAFQLGQGRQVDTLVGEFFLDARRELRESFCFKL